MRLLSRPSFLIGLNLYASLYPALAYGRQGRSLWEAIADLGVVFVGDGVCSASISLRSGIWEGAPHAATCASTSVVLWKDYPQYSIGEALKIPIVSYLYYYLSMILCNTDGLMEVSVAYIQ